MEIIFAKVSFTYMLGKTEHTSTANIVCTRERFDDKPYFTRYSQRVLPEADYSKATNITLKSIRNAIKLGDTDATN